MDLESRVDKLERDMANLKSDIHTLMLDQSKHNSDMSSGITLIEERMEVLKKGILSLDEKIDRSNLQRQHLVHKYLGLSIPIIVTLIGSLGMIAYEFGKISNIG